MMYTYSLVYVLVDNNDLNYYNMLMKSVLSVRLHMTNISINVLVDKETESILKDTDTELYDYTTVIAVETPKGYNQKDRSRYIKTCAREIITGDFLFMDTDTVICRSFPLEISKKSFSIALDQNATFDLIQSPYNCWVNELAGLQDITDIKYYFNSGIIWVKDDEFAHRIYRHWHELWEQIHAPNKHQDQPSLNYILREELDNSHFGILDNEWNVQIGGSCNAAISHLLDAYIIHYMRIRDCAFLLCQKEYYMLSYKDIRIQKIIKDPRRAFGIGKLTSHTPITWSVYKKRMVEDQTKKEIENSLQYKLLKKLFAHKKLFKINERVLSLFVGIKRLFKK